MPDRSSDQACEKFHHLVLVKQSLESGVIPGQVGAKLDVDVVGSKLRETQIIKTAVSKRKSQKFA